MGNLYAFAAPTCLRPAGCPQPQDSLHSLQSWYVASLNPPSRVCTVLWSDSAKPSLQACWLLSADTELNNCSKGNVTSIDWPGYARTFKRHLLMTANDPETKELIQLWNREVFPNSDAANQDNEDLQDSAQRKELSEDDDDYIRQLQEKRAARKDGQEVNTALEADHLWGERQQQGQQDSETDQRMRLEVAWL